MRFTKAILVQLLIFILFGLALVTVGRSDTPPAGYLGHGKQRLSMESSSVKKQPPPIRGARRRGRMYRLRPHIPRFHRSHVQRA
jgi:hypothetical protein